MPENAEYTISLRFNLSPWQHSAVLASERYLVLAIDEAQRKNIHAQVNHEDDSERLLDAMKLLGYQYATKKGVGLLLHTRPEDIDGILAQLATWFHSLLSQHEAEKR